ncbi:hypothetical protein [Pontitalea aquivivens]|uniref:hypothetical protein n=1 Tax=Pontitalea aquivivens TaxID=3388663 RepID=UPI0039709B3A
MTISNHITLADIHRMPVGQIAALPADQLALLKGAADEPLTQARSVAEWLDDAISLIRGPRPGHPPGGGQGQLWRASHRTIWSQRAKTTCWNSPAAKRPSCRS